MEHYNNNDIILIVILTVILIIILTLLCAFTDFITLQLGQNTVPSNDQFWRTIQHYVKSTIKNPTYHISIQQITIEVCCVAWIQWHESIHIQTMRNAALFFIYIYIYNHISTNSLLHILCHTQIKSISITITSVSGPWMK